MPIYEWSCLSCEHQFENMQKMADPTPECPKCHKAVKKLFSVSNFSFTGNGWAKDNYGLKPPKTPTNNG